MKVHLFRTSIVALAALFGACALPRSFNLRETSIPESVKQLVREQPGYFSKPLTWVILTDTSPCPKALAESRWWRDWKARTEQAGCGMVFATTRSDSVDVAVAAELDSAVAPILIFPQDKDFARESRRRSGILPLKMLVERNGHIKMYCCYVSDTAYSNSIMSYVDSAANYARRTDAKR